MQGNAVHLCHAHLAACLFLMMVPVLTVYFIICTAGCFVLRNVFTLTSSPVPWSCMTHAQCSPAGDAGMNGMSGGYSGYYEAPGGSAAVGATGGAGAAAIAGGYFPVAGVAGVNGPNTPTTALQVGGRGAIYPTSSSSLADMRGGAGGGGWASGGGGGALKLRLRAIDALRARQDSAVVPCSPRMPLAYDATTFCRFVLHRLHCSLLHRSRLFHPHFSQCPQHDRLLCLHAHFVPLPTFHVAPCSLQAMRPQTLATWATLAAAAAVRGALCFQCASCTWLHFEQ